MANAAEAKLKLLIDPKGKRVLFGEADKNTTDFLFNLLSLPLGTVVRLLKRQGMVGCLSNLYQSVDSLNETYLQPNQSKNIILKPRVSFRGSTLLLPHVQSSSNDPTALCPSCRRQMNQLCTIMNPPNAAANTQQATNEEGGFVKGVVTYMVMDDLTVTPMSTISSIALLNKFNIKEVGALEEKLINLDINQGIKLLRASLKSNTVLTDVFLSK